jgi:ketosteroid isomerase-like protein
MSQENVEIARRSFEAFNRTFNEGTPDLYEMLDPEVEWVPMSALLEGTAYHGHDGVRRWLEDMKRDWTTYEIRPERYLDLGDDRVLTLGAWRARGRSLSARSSYRLVDTSDARKSSGAGVCRRPLRRPLVAQSSSGPTRLMEA